MFKKKKKNKWNKSLRKLSNM